MIARAIAVWLGLLILAIANGAFREAVLLPRTGDTAAHAISSVILSALVLALAWLATPWMDPASTGDAWTIGAVWLALVLAFEFLAGHYVFGTSWRQLLADYDVAHGRLWVLVLIATLVAPRLSMH